MTINELKAGEIRRSVNRFKDYAGDLLASDMDTFDDRLDMFAEFCQSDTTMSRIHHQLLGVPGVDLSAWEAATRESEQMRFPTSTDQRLALMYRLLLGVRSEDIDFLDFIATVFRGSSTRIDDLIRSFTEAVVRPMVRELEYRLEDVLSELPTDNAQAVGLSVIQVITNTGTLVQQVAPGAHQAAMTATVHARRLRELAAALKDAVARADLGPPAKQEAADVANAVAEEAESASPRRSVLGSLLRSLPRVADIARIVDTIRSLMDA